MHAIKIWIAVVTLISLTAPLKLLAQQGPSRTISYQGALAGNAAASHVPDGSYHMTFRLYGDSVGEHTLWEDSYSVDVRNSVFSILLGSGKSPLPPSPSLDRPLWLGVKLEEEPEFRPLSPLTAAPFALNVPDSSITTDKIAPRSVTEDKMATQYVKGISVDGYSVTPSGSNHFVNFQGVHGVKFDFDPSTRIVSVGTDNTIWTAPEIVFMAGELHINTEARFIRVQSSQIIPAIMTGIDHTGFEDGRMITLTNIGQNPIILKNRSNATRPGNQFTLPGSSDVILAANGIANFVYDTSLFGWVFISSN